MESSTQNRGKSKRRHRPLGGFYRRRRGILEHLAMGEIDLFDAGIHDFLCLNANSQVGSGSAIPPGVWVGSAAKIRNLTAGQHHIRTIQRSLQKLERLGWIKRFRTQGSRIHYPILIHRLVVTDADSEDFLVNAEKTTDWRHPVLERVSDVVSDTYSELSLIRSPFLQEIKKEEEEGVGHAAAWEGIGERIGTPEFQRAWELHFASGSGLPLAELMESFIQGRQTESKTVPPPFFEAKRRVEERECDMPKPRRPWEEKDGLPRLTPPD